MGGIGKQELARVGDRMATGKQVCPCHPTQPIVVAESELSAREYRGRRENIAERRRTVGTPNRTRTQGNLLIRVLASCTLIATLSGCLTGPQFRQAALPAIEGGIDQILDGLVAGVFAAIEVESD